MTDQTPTPTARDAAAEAAWDTYLSAYAKAKAADMSAERISAAARATADDAWRDARDAATAACAARDAEA